MSEEDITSLRSYLESHTDCLNENDVVGLLSNCWTAFSGSERTSLTVDKLYRIEAVEWQPPILAFTIERHGGTVQGSSRAEVHKWTLDLDKRSAYCNEGYSYRQLRPNACRVHTRPLAQEVVRKVVASEDDACLKWCNDKRKVRIIVGVVVPGEDVCNQTLAGRRKRFRKDLLELMSNVGWEPVSGSYTYECKGE